MEREASARRLFVTVAEGADLPAVAFVRAAFRVLHEIARGALLGLQFAAAGDALGGFLVVGLCHRGGDALGFAFFRR